MIQSRISTWPYAIQVITAFLFHSTGCSHKLMSLIELEKEFTQYLEPLKQRVEDRFDELSAIVKQTTLSLSQWDTETEQSVSTLHKARDEQVLEMNNHKHPYKGLI